MPEINLPRAYILKRDDAKEQGTPLKIGGNNVSLFLDPLINGSSFLSSSGGTRWDLSFFLNSPFTQNLVVKFDIEKASGKNVLGRAILLKNGDDPTKNKDLTEAASRFLRDSRTLTFSKGIELTSKRFMIADRRGLAYFSDASPQFERIVLCLSLAIAYEQVISKCIADLARQVKNFESDEILVLYEDILRFNASDYFSQPVLLENHEIFNAWREIANHFNLTPLSQELRQQLSDVAMLLTEKQRHAEERKNKKRNLWLGLLGVFFAFMSVCLTAVSLISLLQLTPKQFEDNIAAWLSWWKVTAVETGHFATHIESSSNQESSEPLMIKK